MTTNREWLYSLDGANLAEWFDAEHTSNDTLGAKKVVSADSVDANDGNAASLKDSSDNTQNVTDNRETDETPNNSEADVTDSREKLDADVRKWCGMYAYQADMVWVWLNRQAAITERECASRWQHIAEDRDRAERRNSELRTSYDKLKRERDNLADDLLTCNREREQLRKHLGIALDHAHDMLALVDLDGEVVS